MNRSDFQLGPANLARIQKEGDEWALVLTKELRHSPEKVWKALTDPEQIRQWAPYDADRDMGKPGVVNLTIVGMPDSQTSETPITRAETNRVLEYRWGGNETRWELEATEQGTCLTLWAKIDRKFIAMGAAGWHLCLGVMDQLLAGDPVGRIVGMDALQLEGWQSLQQDYAKQFGVETPNG